VCVSKTHSCRALYFFAAAYIIAHATDVSIGLIPNAVAASHGVYSRSRATHVIFSGLQENACWSITKEHPEKTKSVEKDNAATAPGK
jgi:hypothetical protein